MVASLLLLPDQPWPPWWRSALCVGLLLAASVPWLSARIGNQRMDFFWSVAALAVALTLLPLAWVVPAVTLGAAAALVRQRRQPIKALFNTASPTVGAAFAVAIAIALGPRGGLPRVTSPPSWWRRSRTGSGPTWPPPPCWGWRRAGPSSPSTGPGWARPWRPRWATWPRPLPCCCWSGSIRRALFMVAPALLICLRQAYKGGLRGREERESWQGLMEATRALSDLDEGVVLSR